MSRFISYVLLWLILSNDSTGFLYAQQLIFKSYTVEDGLVANDIRKVFQDSEGFLWISTWDGLSKYDGHKFTNFNKNNGLSFSLVNDIYETVDKRLIIPLNNGEVDVIQHDTILKNAAWSGLVINEFITASDGKVVVPTDDQGIMEFRDEKLIKQKQPLHHIPYYFLAQWGDSLWVGGNNRNLRILNNRYEFVAESKGFYFYCFYQDSQKRLWVGTFQGLKLLAPLKENGEISFAPLPGPFQAELLANRSIHAIFEDREGNFWMGTETGLIKVQPDGHHRLFTKQDGLPDNWITYIFQDREDNIWIGTQQGLAKLVTKNKVGIFTKQDGLEANWVYALYSDNNELWFSTYYGIWSYNKSVRKFTKISETNKYISEAYNYPKILKNIGPPLAYSTGGRVYRITRNGSIAAQLPPMVFAVADGHNTIFGASPNVVGEVIIVRDGEKQSTISFPDVVTGLLIDKSGYVWVGTRSEGLYRVNYTVENGAVATSIKDCSHLLPGKEIRSLFEDRNGDIWVGMRYNGVVCLKKNEGDTYAASAWGPGEGLMSEWVSNIAEDESGNIWLGSKAGLDKLIPGPKGYQVFNFSRATGFFTQINDILPDRGKSLWLATAAGLIHITDGETENMAVPNSVITSATVKHRNRTSTLPLGKEVSLNHDRGNIHFEFSAPSFINEKQILYSYRLSGGTDEAWSKPVNVHTVSYASLQPGKYLFEVKTIGWDGSSGQPASFGFHINPPWWHTWWFRIPLFLLLIGGITFLVRRRIKNIRFKAEIKHKIAETEMMALRAQMNPHFIFNCINSIDALIQGNDKYQATVYLNKFAKLLRNVLDSSMQETISLSKDLEILQLYIDLEQLRNENRFAVSLKADRPLLEDDYKVPPLVVQPFVENAILHGLKNKLGTEGKLSIKVSRKSGYIKYVIEDNGVGRKTPNNRDYTHNKSYGMQMSSDRVKLFNEEEKNTSVVVTDLEKNGNPVGTRVEVLLKIR